MAKTVVPKETKQKISKIIYDYNKSNFQKAGLEAYPV